MTSVKMMPRFFISEPRINERIVGSAHQQGHADGKDGNGNDHLRKGENAPAQEMLLADQSLQPAAHRQAEDHCADPEPETGAKGAADGKIGELGRLAEKDLEEGGHPAEIHEIEYAPAQDDQQQAVEMQHESRHPPAQNRIFLQRDDQAEIHAPEDEVPAGPVPHAGQEPDYQDIEELMPAVSAQRDVEIVAEETAQRNVPSPPEVRDGIAAIRMVEVFLEMETQAAADADGHIRIAGKIEIDLQGESQQADPGTGRRKRGQVAGEKLVGHLGKLVGQDHFLAQADDEAETAVGHVLPGDLPLVDFPGNGPVAHDRTGNQLREHRDVQQQVAEAFLRLAFLPVHIHQVGNGLEGVETDADGKCQLRHMDFQAEAAQQVSEEAQVFERSQNGQIGGQPQCKQQSPALPGPVQAPAEEPVQECAGHQKEYIKRFSPGIED